MGKNLFKGIGLILIAIGVLCFMGAQLHAATYTLVKTIDLLALVGDRGSIEVDVVGNELYVANWIQDKYFRIDPVTGNLIYSFSLGNGIRMDNHGSEYNPVTGRILHASDRDAGGALAYDAFFETDTNGVLTKGPFSLYWPGYTTNDPEGLTVDPISGRVWVSLEPGGGGTDGIFEIDPTDGTFAKHLDVGSATALGFNPNSGKIFFADLSGVIKEVAPDGGDPATVFDPGFGQIFGMAFTPTGDLVLLDFAPNVGGPLPSQLLLYDSSDDADDVFTTAIPIAIDIKPNIDPNTIILTSKGTISVAILTTTDFNANTVDPTTVLFAGASPVRRKMVDVDRDGDIDMLLSFNIEELNLDINSTIATLTGTMDDVMGTIPITGTDFVTIVTKGKK